MIKKVLSILFLLLFLELNCFAEFAKQPDEFTCAPTSSYNLIKIMCPECKTSIQELSVIQKTDKNGTTTFNLCLGLEKYFKSQNKKIDIEYYGIKKVRRYKVSSNPDLSLLKNHLENGGQAIINIGIYTTNPDGTFTRKWGHYANVVGVENGVIKVSDPYDKENEISTWTGVGTNIAGANTNITLKNINDNEKYIKTNEAYFIHAGINYLEPTEFAILNGIIFIKSLSPKQKCPALRYQL